MNGRTHGPIDHEPERKARERIPEQATQAGATGVAAYLLHLQRTIGNRAVGQLLRQYTQQVQRVDAAGQTTLTGLGLTTDALKIAAAVMSSGGQLTVAGHALAKHSVRPGSAFGPEVKGKVSVKNDAAAAIVAELVDGATSTVTARKAGRYGDVIDIFVPGGRGVRFMQTGVFIGFLEP